MPNYDWECANEHVFEQITPYEQEQIECPTCGATSGRVWLAPRSPHRQLPTPIVFWRYSDGSLGVAGGADSKTPKAAERVEVRSIGEYRRAVKELNTQHRNKEEIREERYRENREAMEHQVRSSLAWKMAQETDPYARDIYRAALENRRGGYEKLPFSEYFSVVMEMDKSNYERD